MIVLPVEARSLPEETLHISLSRAQVAKMSLEEFEKYCEARHIFRRDFLLYYAKCLQLRNQEHLQRLSAPHRRQMRILRKLLTRWGDAYYRWRAIIVGPTTHWNWMYCTDLIEIECALARIEGALTHPVVSKAVRKAALPEAEFWVEKEIKEADPRMVHQNDGDSTEADRKRFLPALKRLKASWTALKRELKRQTAPVQEAIAPYIQTVYDNAAI